MNQQSGRQRRTLETPLTAGELIRFILSWWTNDRMTMILAGDIGGTKCNLGLFVREEPALRLVFHRRFATRDFNGIEGVVNAFLLLLAEEDGYQPSKGQQIDAAGFGVAGPVVNGRHYSENLPWLVDASALPRHLGIMNVRLLNDLAASALSLERLPAHDFVSLNAGTTAPNATRGVIAAGTGLGEAILFSDGKKYRVAAAEGGQIDFAPRTDREIQLLTHLRTYLPSVSNEEIISGRGFRRIHEFLDASVQHDSFDSPNNNAAGEITQRGLARSCAVCVETLNFWTEIFGASTGNFALQVMAVGGVYIAGGIAAKILPKLQDGAFFASFCAGKLASVLQRIPVSVVTNEDAPMIGAAYEALDSLSG